MHDDSLSALGFIMIMSWKSFSFCSLLFSFGIGPFSPGVVTDSLRRVSTGSKNPGPLLLQTKTNFPICSINVFLTLIDDSYSETLCSCIRINSTGEGADEECSAVCTLAKYQNYLVHQFCLPVFFYCSWMRKMGVGGVLCNPLIIFYSWIHCWPNKTGFKKTIFKRRGVFQLFFLSQWRKSIKTLDKTLIIKSMWITTWCIQTSFAWYHKICMRNEEHTVMTYPTWSNNFQRAFAIYHFCQIENYEKLWSYEQLWQLDM